MFNFELSGLWTSICADIVKELIVAIDDQLFNDNRSFRDYIWFLKKKNQTKNIHAVIVIFGDKINFEKINVIFDALQELLPVQNFLKEFEINIYSLTSQYKQEQIIHLIGIKEKSLLLDCGFASNFNF